MSVEIPKNMEEVVIKIAKYQMKGKQLDKKIVIRDAVKNIFQSLLDEALEGHYDDALWQGDNLIVRDFTGQEVGVVKPEGENFITDFRIDANRLVVYLENEVIRIIGGR